MHHESRALTRSDLTNLAVSVRRPLHLTLPFVRVPLVVVGVVAIFRLSAARLIHSLVAYGEYV